MAYWIYCTDCKQWNKSATSLSDGMTCSFCNNLLAKRKPYNLQNDAVTEIEVAPNSSPTPEIVEAPKTDDNSSPKAIPIMSETTEAPEVEMMEIAEGQESSEVTEEQEMSAANESEESPEMTVEEVEEVAEVSEESEESEESEILESPESPEEQAAPIVNEITPPSNTKKASLTRTHKKSSRRSGRLR